MAVTLAALALPGSALAGGGDYGFEGAGPAERSTVRAALNASAFDWSIVPQHVTIHVGPYGVSHSTPGDIWLDRGLLGAGRFSWATVMDEYAHQIDFQVLDASSRAVLQDEARNERLVLRVRRPRARSERLRAVLLHGRVGVLAVEGQLLPARLSHGRVRIDAGGRVPHSALVARRQADGAQVLPLEPS